MQPFEMVNMRTRKRPETSRTKVCTVSSLHSSGGHLWKTVNDRSLPLQAQKRQRGASPDAEAEQALE